MDFHHLEGKTSKASTRWKSLTVIEGSTNAQLMFYENVKKCVQEQIKSIEEILE